MKKGIYAFLLLFAAFTLIFTTAFAQSNTESVLIHPLLYPNGSTITVSPDQEIILGIGWAACTLGLERAFIETVRLEWTFNDQLVLPHDEVFEYWSKIREVDPVPGGVCIAGNGTFWGSSWRYSLGYLEPGSYQVHFLEWIAHPFTDGGDYNGDGKIDKFSGTLTDWSVTVNVEVSQ